MSLSPAAVELEGVSFAYGHGPQVLEGVDLRIGQGEFVGIAGPNGGGKTTLVRLALGLERPLAGRALLFGEPAHTFSRCARNVLINCSRIQTLWPAACQAARLSFASARTNIK